jgi:hypothetical protein
MAKTERTDAGPDWPEDFPPADVDLARIIDLANAQPFDPLAVMARMRAIACRDTHGPATSQVNPPMHMNKVHSARMAAEMGDWPTVIKDLDHGGGGGFAKAAALEWPEDFPFAEQHLDRIIYLASKGENSRPKEQALKLAKACKDHEYKTKSAQADTLMKHKAALQMARAAAEQNQWIAAATYLKH